MIGPEKFAFLIGPRNSPDIGPEKFAFEQCGEGSAQLSSENTTTKKYAAEGQVLRRRRSVVLRMAWPFLLIKNLPKFTSM